MPRSPAKRRCPLCNYGIGILFTYRKTSSSSLRHLKKIDNRFMYEKGEFGRFETGKHKGSRSQPNRHLLFHLATDIKF
jgi:hypothetical protein